MQLDPIAVPPAPRGTIIFVHGLGGSSETWSSGSAETFWPRWLAEANPNDAVYVAQYEANVSRRRVASLDLDETAKLLAGLIGAEVATGPLVFVCHSLGGTMVKALLRHATLAPAESGLAGRIRGVYFIATPHLGTRWALPLGLVAWALRQSRWDRSLAAGRAPLALHRWFMEEAFWERIRIGCAYENVKILFIYVVNMRSSTIRRTGVENTPVHRNHSACCKPPSRSDGLFITVNAFVNSSFATGGSSLTPARIDQALAAMEKSTPRRGLLTTKPL